MHFSDPGIVSRFVHFYRGVEEFYFLNREGDLGYIKSKDLRPIKETFPQLKNREFVRSNPDFMRELDGFLRELADVSTTYLEDPPTDLELGYVLPAGEQQEWRTSTLVLHKHVLDSLKADHEMMVQNGTKELVEGERDLARIMGVRSIHQGLDELTHHLDAFGHYRYFPALFVIPDKPNPAPSDRARAKVRVINLRWRDARAQARAPNQKGPQQNRELLFSLLRDNLTQRGAIDRSRRLENRLSIV